MRAPEMQSPPRALTSAERAEFFNSNGLPHTIASTKPEADFAALYIARRFNLPLPMAHTIAALAGLGRALA